MSDLYGSKPANESLSARILLRSLGPHPDPTRFHASDANVRRLGPNQTRVESFGANKPPAPPPTREANVCVDDWDVLFRAVEERLRRTATGPALSATQESTAILQCLDALDRLHGALCHERSRHRQLESDVLEAKTSLSRLRIVQEFRAELVAELHGAQASQQQP